MNLLLLISLFAITLIASAEEAAPVVSMFQSVEATKADTQDPSFELQPGKGQENITEVDSPISAAAEEISRDETNILVPELTIPDTEWAIPDSESLLLAEEVSPEPETATSVSEDARASAESAMELMSLHYVDDEEATSPAAEPIDLYEKETKHSTGEPIHTPEQPNYPIMQPTSLDEGTTLLTAQTTAMATEKITAAAETGIPITESTTPAANTIIATVETTAQAERTITPVETTNEAAEMVIPVRETTSQIEVMTFAELATLKTERIPAVETATVEPTNPVTQETKIVEPTTLAAEAISIDAKTITTTVASFIEQTTRAPETIPAKETVMVAVEQMTPTSPDVKPMTLVSIPANPSTEPELVSTNPIPGTGVTTVNAESLISSTERSVTESTVLAAETMTPAAISVVTKEIIPTMEMTAPVALITNSVAEKTNLTVEQISTGEQTSVVTMDPIRPATLEVELSRTSEKPAIPSVWPASSYPSETIWGGGSATPSTELVIPSTESVTPAKVPATSTADPATPTVGPTIPAAEPGTVTSGPDTPTAKSVTPSIEPVPAAPASGPANPAADTSTLAPEPPTPMAESTTSTADPAARVVGSTMLAAESATSSANLAVLASEPATMAAEPATSTVPELATQTAELATPVLVPATPTALPAIPATEPTTPSTKTVFPAAESAISTTGPTISIADKSTPAAESASPVVEPATSTALPAIQSTETTTPAAESTSSSAKPVTPDAYPASTSANSATPAAELASPATLPATLAEEPSTPALGATTPKIELSTSIVDSATPVADPATLAVGSTVLATEATTLSVKPALPAAESATSTADQTTSSADKSTPAAELASPASEAATLSAKPATPAAEPAIPATEPTIPAALPVTSTPESVTPGAPITIAESRTSVMPHSLSADMAIPTVESISTAVKPISSPNEEPTVSALDRTPETIVAIPATQPHIQSVETTAFTLNVVQTSDRIPVSNNTVPGLEQTSSTTEKGPSSIQPEPLVTERIPLAESTTSVHSTPPATDMMLLVTDLTTGTYVTSPSAGTIIPVETKTNPIPEATTPSATEPTTFTVKEIMLAAESTTTPANNLPVASSTMSGEKRTTRASKRQTTTASPLRPGLETAQVFDAVLGKITNLSSNLRTATESQVKKLKEIWLVFKLYLDTLKNKTTDKSTINATFLLSTPEEVKIWKNLFENFIDKMRNSTGTQVTKIMAAWTALNKFLLSYKGPQTKKPAVIQVKTTSPNKKSTPQTTVNVPVTHVATTRLDNDHGIHIIAAESQPVNSLTSRTAAIQQPHKLADQIEKLQNRLKQSTKKQLEKYRESWMVFKFYLDSFSPESRPNRMPVAYTDFTLSTPEEANRNRQMFLDFVTNLRLTTEYRRDTVLEYWQELKNLLDSYQGIDAETNEKSKERNPRSFEARPQSNRKDQSPAVVAEQNKQISIAQPHKDGETKIAVLAKLAKIAYELQRSTSLKLSQFKENWILLKLYLDSLESNSTDATMNYHFLFSNAKEQKYVHDLYAGFVQNLRRNPDFPLEQLMQAWQVLNEFLNSYKGVDANYEITSADPDSNHKLDPAHPANAISPTEELAFQKSLIKEIGKLSQLS